MSCFSCGRSFNGTVNELLAIFKRDYIHKGVERYFYKLKTDGDVYIVKKDQFKFIFETKIKPNFDKGAEYAHIREDNETSQ